MHIHNCPECGGKYNAQENVGHQNTSNHWFILNRTDDWAMEPKKKTVRRAILWFIALYIIGNLLRFGCVMAYLANGIDPTTLTSFGGSPQHWLGQPLLKTILLMVVIAPIAEETIFRLGLSFKRHIVSLWLGVLPVVVAAYLLNCRDWMWLAVLAFIGIALFVLVVRFTTDEQWQQWRLRFICPAMWVSSIAFGLTHLMAFSVLSWPLAPYIFSIVFGVFLLSCAYTYARVNLGFRWGVLLHFITNSIGALILIAIY